MQTNRLPSFIAPLLFLNAFFASFQAIAFEEVDEILKRKETPAGVVIEITSSNSVYLEKIIDELKSDIKRLQTRFKDMPVAIVSHAKESLILSSKQAVKHQSLHSKVKDLSMGNTTVHVCGTYASWYNLSEDDFPDYINVSPAGPVQVDDYIELGYEHIQL